MNYELITIIFTILLSWASIVWFIWTTHKDTHEQIAGLHERMASLEGKISVMMDMFQSWLPTSTVYFSN